MSIIIHDSLKCNHNVDEYLQVLPSPKDESELIYLKWVNDKSWK